MIFLGFASKLQLQILLFFEQKVADTTQLTVGLDVFLGETEV